MTATELLFELKRIDHKLFIGDKDYAHALIVELMNKILAATPNSVLATKSQPPRT